MENTTENPSFFSSICTERCKGMCCDPWWGIISYSVKKEGGLSDMRRFKGDLLEGIEARAARITEGYKTSETPARALFGEPERYNISIRGIKVDSACITVNLLAMFAFKCRFLTGEKACSAHPYLLGGPDIRPPHCGYAGSLEARPDEKGYCRIIHAAESGDESAVKDAISVEQDSSRRHLSAGAATAAQAAERVIEGIVRYCEKSAPHLLPQVKRPEPGRNDPCYCGSGDKYKKCHGR